MEVLQTSTDLCDVNSKSENTICRNINMKLINRFIIALFRHSCHVHGTSPVYGVIYDFKYTYMYTHCLLLTEGGRGVQGVDESSTV